MSFPVEPNFRPCNSVKNQEKNLEELVDASNASSIQSAASSSSDEYFHPPIIRERSDKDKATFGETSERTQDELDGDQYFEPPIVREADAKSSAVFSSVFSDLHKSSSAFLSELIQALSSIG